MMMRLIFTLLAIPTSSVLAPSLAAAQDARGGAPAVRYTCSVMRAPDGAPVNGCIAGTELVGGQRDAERWVFGSRTEIAELLFGIRQSAVRECLGDEEDPQTCLALSGLLLADLPPSALPSTPQVRSAQVCAAWARAHPGANTALCESARRDYREVLVYARESLAAALAATAAGAPPPQAARGATGREEPRPPSGGGSGELIRLGGTPAGQTPPSLPAPRDSGVPRPLGQAPPPGSSTGVSAGAGAVPSRGAPDSVYARAGGISGTLPARAEEQARQALSERVRMAREPIERERIQRQRASPRVLQTGEGPAPFSPRQRPSPTGIPPAAPPAGFVVTAGSAEVEGTVASDRVEREFDRLRTGRAKYFTRKQMRVGVQDTVTLRISKDTTVWQVPMLDGTLQTRVVPLKVYSTMTATLDGGDAFRIRRIVPDSGRDKQYVSRDTTAEWRWAVTPVQSGNHPLSLRATVVIDDVTKPYEVMHEEIDVSVNMLYSAQQMWFSYWPWLSSVLAALGGLGGLNAWNDWSERRRKKGGGRAPAPVVAATAVSVEGGGSASRLILPRSLEDQPLAEDRSVRPRGWRTWLPWR